MIFWSASQLTSCVWAGVWHVQTTLEGIDIGFLAQGMLGHNRNASVELQGQHFELEAWGWHLEGHDHGLVIGLA